MRRIYHVWDGTGTVCRLTVFHDRGRTVRKFIPMLGSFYINRREAARELLDARRLGYIVTWT